MIHFTSNTNAKTATATEVEPDDPALAELIGAAKRDQLVDEIELSGGFFDFAEKYTLKTSRVHCPARISLEKAAEVRRAAKTVYRALGCRGMARVDLFLTPDHEIVFNEVNTIPGFTAHSRFPSMMQGIGLGFRELLTRLIELGVQG